MSRNILYSRQSAKVYVRESFYNHGHNMLALCDLRKFKKLFLFRSPFNVEVCGALTNKNKIKYKEKSFNVNYKITK